MTATHTGDRHRPALVSLSQLAVHLRRCRHGGGDLSLVPQVVVDGLDCYQALLYQLEHESGQLSLIATSRPALFEKQRARLEAGRVVACQALEDRQLAASELTVIPGEGNDETYSQWLACPILSAQDSLLGVLEVELPRAVDATERHLFQIAADLLAEHLGQVDLHDRVFRSNVYLAQLNDITQQLGTHQDIDAMVNAVALGLAEMMGVEEIALYLMENAVPRLAARGGQVDRRSAKEDVGIRTVLRRKIRAHTIGSTRCARRAQVVGGNPDLPLRGAGVADMGARAPTHRDYCAPVEVLRIDGHRRGTKLFDGKEALSIGGIREAERVFRRGGFDVLIPTEDRPVSEFPIQGVGGIDDAAKVVLHAALALPGNAEISRPGLTAKLGDLERLGRKMNPFLEVEKIDARWRRRAQSIRVPSPHRCRPHRCPSRA